MGSLLNRIRPDSLLHLKGGALVAPFFLLVCMLAAKGYYGTAIAGGATLALIAFEVYQHRYGTGAAEWSDVAFGAAPAWVIGALVGIYGLPLP